MKQSERNYKRIVVKIGSSLFCKANNTIDLDIFEHTVRQVSDLVRSGKEVAVVSSGAIALGMHLLGLRERPRQLKYLQAAAAVGQNELMSAYHRFFRGEFFAAQILLTWEDFIDRKRYLNAKNTLNALLEQRRYNLKLPVPVINENDTVSTDEIKFGDNDRLSALVASLVSADLLIILSDVDGLLDKDKRVVRVVSKINQQIRDLACPTNRATCVGGMITKIEAAKMAVDSGIACVIANGYKSGIIAKIADDPASSGTLFLAEKKLAERQRWIAFGTKPKGRVIVDEGAKKALINKKSLLSVGITGVAGGFECGDIVAIVDKDGSEFARGKACLSCRQLDKTKGTHTDKEAIHCDNIVLTG